MTRYPSTDRLTQEGVDGQMKAAMAMWEEVTNLKFIKKDSGRVHIEISFVEGEHGDGDPFDGPGGTLAHAYFPQFGGDVHMDDTEYWTIDSFKGTNLLQTLTHELGHSLGLSHSEVEDAMMAPFYRGWEPDMKLHADDIAAIRVLYGEKACSSSTGPFGQFFSFVEFVALSESQGDYQIIPLCPCLLIFSDRATKKVNRISLVALSK